MTIEVTPVPLEEVLPLRQLYRHEMNCQIVHDSLPGRGFGNLFLLRVDGRVAGYGFVMGYRGEPKDMIQEFYVLPAYRGSALAMFHRLIETSQARRIEVQTNFDIATSMRVRPKMTLCRRVRLLNSIVIMNTPSAPR